MRRCKKFRLYIDETYEGNCPGCIFNDKMNNKCKFDEWNPGLKSGKDLSKLE